MRRCASAREQRPSSCVVIGIRSIGASLSTVVAEAVHAVWRFTVRPRGHPFERELRLGAGLEQRVRAHAGDWFLIVDEGPGLSGSSFISVATKLEELGVVPETDSAVSQPRSRARTLRSERARVNWRRYRRYVEPFRSERFVPAKRSRHFGRGVA